MILVCSGLTTVEAGAATGLAIAAEPQNPGADFKFETAIGRNDNVIFIEGQLFRTSRPRKAGEQRMVASAACSFEEDGKTIGDCMTQVVILAPDVLAAAGSLKERRGFQRRFSLDLWTVRKMDETVITAECDSEVDSRNGKNEVSCVTRYLHFRRAGMQVKFSDSPDPLAEGEFILGIFPPREITL
jgi:hypothetical protein